MTKRMRILRGVALALIMLAGGVADLAWLYAGPGAGDSNPFVNWVKWLSLVAVAFAIALFAYSLRRPRSRRLDPASG